MSTLGLRALDVVAEQHRLAERCRRANPGADGQELSVRREARRYKTAGRCARRAEFGGRARGAARRKLSYAGLQALVRLLEGAKVQACTLLHVKLLDARSHAELSEVLGHCSTLLMRDCFSLTPVHLTALRELRVSYGALGTEVLNSIVAACPPQLEGLILAGCSATTKDPFLAALGSAPCAQNLRRRLDLAGMKKLTSQGFNGHIRDRLPRLEMLGLDGCDNVDMGEILFIHDTVAPFPRCAVFMRHAWRPPNGHTPAHGTRLCRQDSPSTPAVGWGSRTCVLLDSATVLGISIGTRTLTGRGRSAHTATRRPPPPSFASNVGQRQVAAPLPTVATGPRAP